MENCEAVRAEDEARRCGEKDGGVEAGVGEGEGVGEGVSVGGRGAAVFPVSGEHGNSRRAHSTRSGHSQCANRPAKGLGMVHLEENKIDSNSSPCLVARSQSRK